MRTRWIRLWQWTAWGGIGLSLYAGWLTVDDLRDRAAGERAIGAACGGLVPPAEVMDLHGGTGRAETGDSDRIDVRLPASACTVHEVPGPGGTKSLFTLTVWSSGPSKALNPIGDEQRLEPFLERGDPRKADSADSADVTAVADRRPEPRPLADGVLGRYGDGYATVRAECGPGSAPKAPALLYVTARAEYDDVSAADRGRLARLARAAAAGAADRIGCRARLPELPEQPLPTVPSALRPAREADGSCGWFAAHLARQGTAGLPDRFLATPALAANPVESCLLAVGPDQVERIAEGLPDTERRSARRALEHSPWWLRTVSYFGPEAHTVGYDDLGRDRRIGAGTAGYARNVWWASSVCDGRPALHTLSSSYTYDNTFTPERMSALFRAYVDDVTERRGCTRVTHPTAKDFRSLGD
ncbi:hypothetical protein ACFQ9J_05290 [Streptomyces sp. NPDC056529]|uniref:hypothetical protein n=1 Tax=Streptomyces sp. NPDC056529 TaxID=3345855 RepID=UPI0036879BB5